MPLVDSKETGWETSTQVKAMERTVYRRYEWQGIVDIHQYTEYKWKHLSTGLDVYYVQWMSHQYFGAIETYPDKEIQDLWKVVNAKPAINRIIDIYGNSVIQYGLHVPLLYNSVREKCVPDSPFCWYTTPAGHGKWLSFSFAHDYLWRPVETGFNGVLQRVAWKHERRTHEEVYG